MADNSSLLMSGLSVVKHWVRKERRSNGKLLIHLIVLFMLIRLTRRIVTNC